MPQLADDLRLALRATWKRPGTSLLVILTLAVGITVNTVVFSLLNGMLFKPFVFEHADRLARVFASSPGERYGPLSVDELNALRTASRTLASPRSAPGAHPSRRLASGAPSGFEDVAGESPMGLGLRTASDAATRHVWSLIVSDHYLDVVGVTPIRGRTFGERDRGQLTVVVSEPFWREQLGGASDLGGLTLTLNNQTFAVAGVLPASFRGFGSVYMPEVWVPLSALAPLGLEHLARPDERWLFAAGRMRAGIDSAPPLQAELNALAPRILRQPADGAAAGASNAASGATSGAPSGVASGAARARTFVTTLMRDGHPESENLRPIGLLAMGAVGLVLLLACFNVTGLLLARARERQREMGMRAALGASHGRLVRQLLTESLLLAAMAGAAAFVVSMWSYDLLYAFRLPAPIPQSIDMRPDWRLALFAVGLSAAAGVLPGLAPAWHVRRLDLLRVLKNDDRTAAGSPQRGQRALLLAQIAGSTCLLAVAALFVRSFQQTSGIEPGFETRRALVLEVDPVAHGYPDVARSAGYYEQVLQRLRALPGVREAAVTSRPPGGVGVMTRAEVSVETGDCRRTDCPRAEIVRVGAGYFDALRIPLMAGAAFDAADRGPAAPREDDVIVSERLAAQLWPGRSPIGAWIRVGNDRTRFQVRGVAREVNHVPPTADRWPEIYRLLRDDEMTAGVALIVGTQGDPAAASNGVREALRAIDPDVPIIRLKTMTGHLELARWGPMTLSAFSATCALVALVLATVGLFGLAHRTVGQRLREFGVRSALGASPRQLLALVLRDGLRLALPGVLLGTAAAALVSQTLRSALVEVSATDPTTYAGVACLQALVVLAACVLPARRAARVDPLTVLRSE